MTDDLALAASRAAHAAAVPRVHARARGALLDARVPDPPDDRTRRGVSQSAAGRRANRGGDARRWPTPLARDPLLRRGPARRGRRPPRAQHGTRACSSPSRAPTAASSIATTTRIPRDGRRGCWPIARSRRRPAASIPCQVQDDVAREAGSRYIDFLVPGLVGMGIMSNAIWGLGFSIVDARRRKLMKRIVATPMPPA